MVTETIDLPQALDEAIESAAKRTGKAKHELMLEVLQRGFAPPAREEQESPAARLRSLGAVSVPGVQSTDIDEWLAANWRPDEGAGRAPK